MSSVLNAVVIYLMLLLIFRVSGKRTLAHITTFDFVLTLIISEAIQQGMIGSDSSITNAFLLVVTLIGLNIVFSLLKQRFDIVEKLVDDMPVVVVEKGLLRWDRMNQERVDKADVLNAARSTHGIGQLEDIDYAVLEHSGMITIIPKRARRA